MAWYEVECESCKEMFKVQLFGKMKDREWKIQNWTWTCEKCRAEELQKKSEAAAAANLEAGLPPLQGSEKQIAWAESIRAEAQPTLNKLRDKCHEAVIQTGEKEKYEEALKALEYVAKNPSAKCWIDNRDKLNEVFFFEEMKRVLPEVRKNKQNGGVGNGK